MYIIKLDLREDEITMLYDMIRMSVIQIVTQMLVSIANPSIDFLNPVFLSTFIFINISIAVYWMIIKKLIKIESNNGIRGKDIVDSYK